MLVLGYLMGASLIIQKFSESFSGSLKRETGSKLSPPNLPPIWPKTSPTDTGNGAMSWNR